MCCSTDIFLGCLAVLFPPIAVWIKIGICTPDSLINLALCTLGYFPGLLHAWYIIAKYPDPEYEYETIPSHTVSSHPYAHDPESGSTHHAVGQHGANNVTYYYVSQGGPASAPHAIRPQQGGRLRSGESAGSVGSGGNRRGEGGRGSQQKYPVQKNNLGVPQQQQYGTIGNNNGAGEASSGDGQGPQQHHQEGNARDERDEGGVPPSYDQAVRGDNKVQTS